MHLLWHTFDTTTLPRSGVKRARPPKQETKDLILNMFTKYGHYIRRLTVHRNVILEAASICGRCTNLISLDGGGVMAHWRQTASSPVYIGRTDRPMQQQPVVESTDGEGGEWEDMEDRHAVDAVEDRKAVEWFWILVQENLGLFRLKLPTTHSAMDNLVVEYMEESLSTLKNLKELDLERLWLDIKIPLDALPRLERLQGYMFQGLTTLQQDYNMLRYLAFDNTIEIPDLLQLLRRLPGLEDLRIGGIRKRVPMETSKQLIEVSGKFPRLREFRSGGQAHSEDRFVALLVGKLFPELRRLWMRLVGEETRRALWEGCYFLESLGECGGAEGGIEAWRERREKDVEG